MPNGVLRQANLKSLFEKAKQFETASFKGLYNFINFIDKLKLGSGDLGSAKLIGENDDVVRIMSIHKSKGLEFPVVFLSNVGKQFNMQSIKIDKILIHNSLGLGMKYINHDMQVEYDTNAKTAVKSLLEVENISEEMRVLYVALTRAKEKLIITGVCKDYEKQLGKLINEANIYNKQNNKINPILLKKCKSYLDWIMLNFSYDEEKDISQELYRVRCLKILLYSNEIATTSSAIQTWVRMAYGDITSAKYFDFGGAINTLYREMTTPLKIAEIQHEYLTSKGINYLKT
jgi:ATP-dependent helicase/nuclease subunit A